MSTAFRNFTLGVSLAAFVGSVYVYTLTRVGTVSAFAAHVVPSAVSGVGRPLWLPCTPWMGRCTLFLRMYMQPCAHGVATLNS